MPFAYKWSAAGGNCLNCAGPVPANARRRGFCSGNCKEHYRRHDGPRPIVARCVGCNCQIDLNALARKGTRRVQTTVKFCKPCKQDYAKYKMSARELALRDGPTCGICGDDVDMSLTRADGLMCPSVDHVLPRSRGGSHDATNLQLAHLVCNMRKSDRVVA